ncbi:MAG: hypothetical protein IKW38_06695 [Kiritimatiellae bacterium]|nr:hypothetical protein [Kiritimatiellia bacterium]
MATKVITQDASKRLVNFYLDEADAVRLDKYCADRGVSRTQFLAGVVAQFTAHITLTEEDIALINEKIQKRIEKGYPQNFRSESRYKRD